MSTVAITTKNNLRTIILDAMGRAVASGVLLAEPILDFTIEIPSDRSHGDFATNIAMVSAKAFKMAPRKIAEAIAPFIDLNGSCFDKFEIAGPGFINFFLNSTFYALVVKEVLEQGDNFGRSDYGKNKKVIIEFVSANPTGPMHMGNARGGALGDCLASIMQTAGYNVWREFYINDAGNQIEKFGCSLEARYLQIHLGEINVPFPEDGYQGGDIKDLAQEYTELYGNVLVEKSSEERKKALIDFALPKNIAKMKEDIAKYKIVYDKWFNESELHNSGEVLDTIELLKSKGMTYEQDGALWYKSTAMGAEKDDVLVRKNGNPTYFAADIAYHRNKLEKRGFDLCIDVWGADHHGHVARMKGAMNAIGLNGNNLDVILMQLVKLYIDGEPARMSKRTGKAIQLRDLLDEVPVDSVRFLFNTREANSPLDFDLGIAVKQDSQNPVYYVQYAHARICSIIRKLESNGIVLNDCKLETLKLLCEPEEIELINHLSKYTEEIISSAKDYDPTRITKYVIELATLFHKFYNACRVQGENLELTQARLSLCVAVKTVIKNILVMFKIDVPEVM